MAEPATFTVKANIKGILQTPRKVSIVTDLVRGRSVSDALIILDHTPRRAALQVKKAIQSAASNAVNNHGLDRNSLAIQAISVSNGPKLKRFKPASRGRALPFSKTSSHLLVQIVGTEKIVKKPTPKVSKEDKEK